MGRIVVARTIGARRHGAAGANTTMRPKSAPAASNTTNRSSSSCANKIRSEARRVASHDAALRIVPPNNELRDANAVVHHPFDSAALIWVAWHEPIAIDRPTVTGVGAA